VHWAAEEARRRGVPLTLVHAWKEPLDVSIDLADLPDVEGPAGSHAQHGRAAAVLLAHDADVLVLGGHSPHVTHATRLLLHRAKAPVVVVPDSAVSGTGRIVVGVTRTDASLAALRWAASAADMRGAVLVVVHVWQLHREQAEEFVRTLGGDVAAGIEVEVRAVHGAPLDRLLELGNNADLLVLGRHVHHGVGRLLHASIADEAAMLAPCAVAVVPAS
jgi:nucleotide-binding universal stress UspA family protein